MTTKRSAAAATIFSRVWAPPPPFTTQRSAATWSAPSTARSRRGERVLAGERLDAEPERERGLLGRGRRGDAAQLEAAWRERFEKQRRGRAGAETDRHSVLDERRRGLGGEPLLALEVHAHVRATIREWRPAASDVAGGSGVQ